ncbi:hypothetical protein LCGC14_0829550 [marine sediment metagenome]|uniref:Uncharacterized protein n=1 Tax=marine sediment metagenome TaxID=412755 RepID=A0A0F9PGD4_9ZZZZ
MLTHMFRRSIYADWAMTWLDQHLPRRPAGVAVDERGTLVMELADDDEEEDTWRWAPDHLMKRLRQSDSTAQTIYCCWQLCRHYDDRQETSVVVTKELATRLGVEIEPTVWYWADQHDVLVTEATVVGEPKTITDVNTKQTDANVQSITLQPSRWLHRVLWEHLKLRAFPQQEQVR